MQLKNVCKTQNFACKHTFATCLQTCGVLQRNQKVIAKMDANILLHSSTIFSEKTRTTKKSLQKALCMQFCKHFHFAAFFNRILDAKCKHHVSLCVATFLKTVCKTQNFASCANILLQLKNCLCTKMWRFAKCLQNFRALECYQQ